MRVLAAASCQPGDMTPVRYSKNFLDLYCHVRLSAFFVDVDTRKFSFTF